MGHDIAYYAKDGRLCEPSDGKRYRMRDLIKERERLGRPLTEEEAKKFEVAVTEYDDKSI